MLAQINETELTSVRRHTANMVYSLLFRAPHTRLIVVAGVDVNTTCRIIHTPSETVLMEFGVEVFDLCKTLLKVVGQKTLKSGVVVTLYRNKDGE